MCVCVHLALSAVFTTKSQCCLMPETTSALSEPPQNAYTLSPSSTTTIHPSVLIGSISVVVVKWVLMYVFNGWDAVLQHFSALSPTCRPTLWKFATEPREMECGHCEVEERHGQPSVAVSRGRVSEAFCRAICSSLG